jgi:hypothetical protein
VVLAVEITLFVALAAMLALNWRAQRRLDVRTDALYEMSKAVTQDAQRTKLAADQAL